jgi:WD40 repeat protein
MNDVFISYSRRDKVFTQKLYEALTAAERSVWADWDSIPAASDWDAEIKQGIQETNSVLFVLSPEWIKSNECRKEMVHAVQMGKRLFPILYLAVDPNNVPPELAKINWVYLRDSDDFDKGFQTLCSAMDTDLDWIKTHTRIQVRALEWEKKNRSASFALRGEDLTEGEQFVASGAEKNPVPTHLQSEYILASRTDATRRQRQTLAGVTVALVISIALGLLAFFQRQEAIRQAQISRVGELAAQSVSVRDKEFLLSLLLGIEAFKHTGGLFTSPQAQSALLDNTQTNPQLEKFLSRHSSYVATVAFSPDGKTLASGSGDNTIMLWDIETGQPIGQLTSGLTSVVTSVAFSPDGKTLASNGGDGLLLWDIETRQQLGRFGNDDQGGSLNLLAFSVDGKVLASDSGGNSIILWDVATRQPIGPPLSVPSGQIHGLAFSPDGKILASGSAGPDSRIILWDIATHQPIGEPLILESEREYAPGISSLAFSPDGKILASGQQDADLTLWDVATHKPIGQPLSGHFSSVVSLAFSPDGKTLASAGDSTIIFWDMESHSRNGTGLSIDGSGVSSIAFSPDGKTLASDGGNNTIVLWDIDAYQPIGQPLSRYKDGNGEFSAVFSITFSPDGKTLASGNCISQSNGICNRDEIALWNLATHQPSGQPLKGHSGRVYSAAFSPDGKTLASAGCGVAIDSRGTCSQGEIILWDVETRQPIGQPINGHSDLVRSVAFSPDGKLLASGSYDSTIILWDVETHQPIGQPLSGHLDSVYSVAFSPTGKKLASGSKDTTIILWDVAAHQPIGQPLSGHLDIVRSVSFSLDGKILASGSEDKTIIFWNVAARQPISQRLSGHSEPVRSVAFSPDGTTLASGSPDLTIILWDVGTHQPIGQPISSWYYQIYSVAFSPDGKTLASGNGSNVPMLWHLDPQSWIEISCQRAGRNFTRAEWAKYFPNEDYRKTCEQWPLEPEVTSTPTVMP